MELMQIDRTSQWGAVRFVQAYLIEGGEAYVVTATCLKQEFSALASQLHKAMQSFTLVPEEKMLHTNSTICYAYSPNIGMVYCEKAFHFLLHRTCRF